MRTIETPFVELIEKPDGYTTQHLPLTVGNHYMVLGTCGSNVIITTDDENLTASIWRGRVSRLTRELDKARQALAVGE